MRKSKELHTAEEWLVKNWVGESYKLFSIEESIKEAKSRVNKYIHKQLEDIGQTSPPFNPESLFGIRKIISKTEQPLSDNFSGFLRPIKGGFSMKINSKQPSKRKRFTIAHEIGHTFFYDLEPEIPVKPFIKSNSHYWVEEDYVNSIASEILLPKPYLNESFNKNCYPPTLKSIITISNLYQVSHEVVSKQVIRNLRLWDCLYFQCEKNNGGTIQPKLSTIVKGHSFQNRSWTIPKRLTELQQDSKTQLLTLLYKRFLPMFQANSNNIIENEFKFKDNLYKIEARQLYDVESKICEVIIVKK